VFISTFRQCRPRASAQSDARLLILSASAQNLRDRREQNLLELKARVPACPARAAT
jgi:hypothetical protein